MTPKEKAKKMVDAFERKQPKTFNGQNFRGINYDLAKESALLCVNVVLQPFLIDFELIEHWKQVRIEIEKL